jgi:hypothetical protein
MGGGAMKRINAEAYDAIMADITAFPRETYGVIGARYGLCASTIQRMKKRIATPETMRKRIVPSRVPQGYEDYYRDITGKGFSSVEAQAMIADHILVLIRRGASA